MKFVAIIGPFRADTDWQRELNIDAAHDLAREVWRLGAVAYCPHMMTGSLYGQLPESLFLAGHLAMLAHMDGGITVPGWEASQGSRAEVAALQQQGKPVFHNLEDLREWLHQG